MKYELLSKYYYKNKELYEKEYENRKKSLSSINFNVDINGINAFVTVTPEIIRLISEIYKKNREVERKNSILPGVAKSSYENNCLNDEIMLTNDIEGVMSTRKEIIDAIESVDDYKQLRFKGLVKKYMLLLKEKHEIDLTTCQKIRDLYDEIVSDEVVKQDKPDGLIFRKESVSIKSSTQQIKHTGLMPEDKIVDEMKKALSMLQDENIAIFIRIAVFHYLIGYIHPFYDGNGRLSRFISSYLLSRELSPLVSCRLSYAIKNNKDAYYKAFDLCNDKKNKGDITFFVIMFLELILNGIDNILEKIDDGYEKFLYFRNLTKGAYDLNNHVEVLMREMLGYLIQNSLFDYENFDRDKLAKASDYSYQTVTKILNCLIDDHAPITIINQGKKIKYGVDIEKVTDYLEEKIKSKSSQVEA